MKSYHVGVSAEAFVAAIFARAGFHVSVQYGANQPGYDLIVEKEKKSYLISVKGSQDGGWGLTQSHLKNADYQAAIDSWYSKHTCRIIFCFVQFKGKDFHEMPDFYLARSSEVADHLRASGLGLGDTILHVEKTWKSGRRAGHTDCIPKSWLCTKDRINQLCNPEAEPVDSDNVG